MRLLSWNVNGIRAVQRKGFLDWLDKEQPDVLCVQETKASPEQVSEKLREPEGYNAFWHSAERKGYSGVVTFSKKKPKAVSFGLGKQEFDSEGRVIGLEYPGFVLFNVYFPNGKMSEERLNYKMDFYNSFLEKIDSLRKKGKSIVFCGDVNTAHKEIDLAHPKANEDVSGFLPIERAWIDKVIDHVYKDSFRWFHEEPEQYSWWSYRTRARQRNVGWRLDYFFVSEDLIPKIKSAFIMQEVMGSDHCPVGIELTGE